MVTAGVNGLLAVNVAMNLTNLTVRVNCTAPPTELSVTDGVLLCYHNWRMMKNLTVIVSVKNYVYFVLHNFIPVCHRYSTITVRV